MPNTRRLYAALLAPLLLAGCGLPIGVQIASLFADGISVLATDKTLTDHGISAVTKKDCALWRGIEGEDICQEVKDNDVVVAETKRIETTEIAERKIIGASRSPDSESGQASGEDLEQNWGATASVENDKSKNLSEETPEFPQEVSTDLAAAPSFSTRRPVPVAKIEKQKAPTTLIVKAAAPIPAAPRSKARKIQAAPMVNAIRRGTGGTYYIIASYHQAKDADRFSRRQKNLKTSVIAGTAKGRQVYRVAVGPVSKNQRHSTKNRLKRVGYRDTWRLTLRRVKKITEVASATR